MKQRIQTAALQATSIVALALAGTQAHAACTFGSSGESSLQSRFDTLLGSGTLNATTACGDRGWTHQFISTGAFGFYLSTRTNGTFFSQSSRNADGVDHLYAYQGTGTPFFSGPLSGEVFALQDYLLAWEDQAGGGDRDYQDFVALVQDVTPVPLPTPVLMLMSGLIGLAGVSRRKA